MISPLQAMHETFLSYKNKLNNRFFRRETSHCLFVETYALMWLVSHPYIGVYIRVLLFSGLDYWTDIFLVFVHSVVGFIMESC